MEPKEFLNQDLRDSIILEALSRGEDIALKRIIEKYYNSLFSYGFKLCSDRNLVADCIQDIFLYFWEKRDSVSEIKSIQSYLFSALRNNILKKQQQVKKNIDISEYDSFAVAESYAEQTLIDSETAHSLKVHLHHGMELLPKRQREALYLRYYENLSYEKIAEIMGLNRQAVGNYLQHALHALRKSWKYAIIFIGLFNL